jgi:hypothetical protein
MLDNPKLAVISYSYPSNTALRFCDAIADISRPTKKCG